MLWTCFKINKNLTLWRFFLKIIIYFFLQGTISTLATNTVGPLVMAKYFVPLLQKGTGAFGQQPPEKEKQHSGIIVNMTARVGSIGDNGLYPYPKQFKSKFFSIMFTGAFHLRRSGRHVVYNLMRK